MNNIKISVCTLNQKTMNFENNLKNIIHSISISKKRNSDIIVLPELVITGYNCYNDFYDINTYNKSLEIIREICNHDSLTHNILLVLGSLIIYKKKIYNCVFFISNNKIILIRPKIILANDKNYKEEYWFSKWKYKNIKLFKLKDFHQQKNVPIGNVIINYKTKDEINVKIATEICEELWSDNSLNKTLFLNGADIIVNSSASFYRPNKLNIRKELINNATKLYGGIYCYSNHQGYENNEHKLYFDGRSMISMNGRIIESEKNLKLNKVKVITKEINLDKVYSYRNTSLFSKDKLIKLQKKDKLLIINC